MLAKIVKDGPKLLALALVFVIAVIQIKRLKRKEEFVTRFGDALERDSTEEDKSVVLKIFDKEAFDKAKAVSEEERETCVSMTKIKVRHFYLSSFCCKYESVT